MVRYGDIDECSKWRTMKEAKSVININLGVKMKEIRVGQGRGSRWEYRKRWEGDNYNRTV